MGRCRTGRRVRLPACPARVRRQGQDRLALQAGHRGQPLQARASRRRRSRPPARSASTATSKADRRARRSTASTSIRPSATTRAANSDLSIDPEERSIALYQAARYSQHCRVFAPMYRQVTLAALFNGGDHRRGARDRLRRRGRGVEDLPDEVQPRPGRRPDRPLAGNVRPPPADPRLRRPEEGRPQAAGLGDPARRQRPRPAGLDQRRRLPHIARLRVAASRPAA